MAASAYDKAVELYSVIYIKGLKPPRDLWQKLTNEGVVINSMGKPEEKQVADEEIITQIKAWAETCRKGTMLLTTSDGDYGELMTSLEKSAYTTELGPAGSMVSPTLKIVVWAETKEEACVDWLATRHGIITGDLLHLLNGVSIPERIRRQGWRRFTLPKAEDDDSHSKNEQDADQDQVTQGNALTKSHSGS
ncbi:hypothetical protein AT1G48730 [Arabidopsis thaliana]|uniref:Uncharacterized protein F11I4_10 n=1 Tax=Arabidopsis thaliana TaxID=3702 RepID=Q9C741_ARATH|nr:uncharacterized protein AT1G48730 [Arabidopsis thaliana]AAG60129.1 hypothetical protein [Arabidopsis thaliana]AEE32340.1 hypothetical protein AT1G48730 [Arabidopsis thaliana]|eukprot:NP_175305.1 hypothetical protein AT1G48730 [Arabidopsis thaliana]